MHLGVDHDGFVDFAADLSVGRVPERPFLLFGQMTTSDPTRSPEGTESAWAYTHVPHGVDWTPEAVAAHVERMEDAVERVAPGFRDSQVARHVQSPLDLEAADASLVGGAINGGTAGLHQQLVFRPTPGLGRPETPVPGLYLASASAHPGGGVHGACGWNAARAALGAAGATGGAAARARSVRRGTGCSGSRDRLERAAALGEVGEPAQRLDVARADERPGARAAARACRVRSTASSAIAHRAGLAASGVTVMATRASPAGQPRAWSTSSVGRAAARGPGWCR